MVEQNQILETKELSIPEKEIFIRNYFLEKAKIEDADSLFIKFPEMNSVFDPMVMGPAAELIAHEIITNDIPVDYVTGIAVSGVPFTSLVTDRLVQNGVRCTQPGSRKSHLVPSTYENTIKVNGTKSFTTDEKPKFAFHNPNPDKSYIIVDDVDAGSYTKKDVIEEFLRRGIKVTGYFSFLRKCPYCDLSIENENGIYTFSVINVLDLDDNGLVLASPHYSTPTP